MANILGSLANRVLLPTIKADNPIDTEGTAFFVNTECRPWFKNDKHVRRAGVSAFGFGGTNYHITVEEYAGKNRAKKIAPFTLIPLSGDIATEQKNIEETLQNRYITSESNDLLMGEYCQKFDATASQKAIFIGDGASSENLELIKTGTPAILSLPKQFNVFAGAQITCTFDAAREYWEGLSAEIRQAVYPVFPPQGVLDESFNLHFENFLKTIFKHFGIHVSFESNGTPVPADLSWGWFLRTLAQMAISSTTANFKHLSDEFQLAYVPIQKPKFSVPLAGYNYGRPSL